MTSFQTQLRAGRETLTVTVQADNRLRRYARWSLRGQTITLRVPSSMTRPQIEKLIEDITPRIARQRKRAHRQSDVNLMERADELNRVYFGGELSWHSIRWVNNMNRRLGSFTTGGTTDGDIRLSERLRNWPAYVIDYVLAHEICHRKFAHHGPEFWEYLSRYPHAQKALGFIEGIAFAEGSDPDSLID
jgi:predicted metal-dependent hydrolase